MSRLWPRHGARTIPTDPVIEAYELTHRYGDRTALSGVSFSVSPGQMFGLLGPNGGGKSTTFKILSTFDFFDDSTFIIAAVRAASTFVPENDQNFASVGGLDDKTTAYNIRFAPVYMFLNHALIINSSLFRKDLSKIIQNTNAEINKAFTAQFAISEACKLGDSQRLLRASIGNIEIGDNFVGQRLWNPIQHVLRVAMTNDQLNTIIDAMENNALDPNKNLGYLTYRDNDGNIKSGYPIGSSIIWNPNDETADITTLESKRITDILVTKSAPSLLFMYVSSKN